MDFIDQLKQFSKRAEQLKSQILTEEGTKTSLIMPFFQLLGYDIFNPSEFVPEFTADVGIKKGEKVDYAILKDGQPVILIEAKSCNENLQKHDSQLFRYFGTTKAKFGILTNGIIYRFYTDLDEQNKMDEKPFLEFNLLEIKDSLVPELKKFQNQSFDLATILNTASELKYAGLIKNYMAQQMSAPDDAFVRTVLADIYQGTKTQNVINKFRDVVKKSINQYVSELMNDKIKAALEKESKDTVPPTAITEEAEQIEYRNTNTKIATTEEELEGYFIVKSIIREMVTPSKISYKDTESYLGILFDNNIRKWICRLQLNGTQKYLVLPTDDKKTVKHAISNVEEIYNYKDTLIAVTNKITA